jgi:hypothetical protein
MEGMTLQEESGDLHQVAHFLEDKLFSVIKLILLEKNVLIYSHKPSNLSKFILALLHFLPPNNDPLLKTRYFSDSYGLKMYASIGDLEELSEGKNYLLATTNELVKQKFPYDVLLDIHQNDIIFNTKNNLLSSHEKKL